MKDLDKICTYCGSPSQCKDHILPVSAFKNGKRHGKYSHHGFKSLMVNSCLHCNSILGNKRIESIFDRKEHIAKRLEEKNVRLLKSPDWTDEELETLGKGLRRSVEMTVLNKKVLQIRIENLRSIDLHSEPMPYDGDIEL